MSLKQWLKQKLPFTRSGLENYIDQRLRAQQEELMAQIKAELRTLVNDPESGIIQRVAWQVGDAIEAQIPWRLNDLQHGLSEELKAQLHQMVNDPESGIIQRVAWRTEEAIEAQIPWRLNDLHEAVERSREFSESLFWFQNSRPGETMGETKRRVFMTMPDWGGEVAMRQQGGNYLLK